MFKMSLDPLFGASLLAMAGVSLTSKSAVRPPSRAGSLLQGIAFSGGRVEVVEGAVDGQFAEHHDLLNAQQGFVVGGFVKFFESMDS
jgi:hypothetical protein